MDRPLRFAAGMLACACSALASAAEPASDAPAPKRTVSPRVAEMLAAARPKFEPAPANAPAPSAPIARFSDDRPANDIIRLPTYIVRERKLPKRDEVWTEKEQARIGMERYIGPEDGFDRGFLNLINLASLWKKVPVLGKVPLAGFMTNEERGLMLYREAKRKEELENWTDLIPRNQRQIIERHSK